MLFAGVNREDINLNPIFEMAAEYFTHLAVVFLNPGGPQAGPSTPDSVNDIISMETDQLLALANQGGLGTQKQEALKRLAFERDGARCVMTGVKFNELPTDTNFTPILDHIIPNSIHGKPDTLECLAKFAGELARDLVLRYMNGIGNVANFQTDAHSWRNKLRWGIEAREEGGNAKYIYRRVPYSSDTGPAGISLRDGDEIRFGGGTKGVRLGKGPIPLLCNVQLAVARVLHMSGAAEAVMQLKQDSDDSDTPHAYVASDYFPEILDGKLLLQSIRV